MYTSHRLKREPIVNENLAHLRLWGTGGSCARRRHASPSRTTGTRKVLARRGLKLQIRLWARVASHLVG
jgi:hypothetical protein